MYSRQQFDKDVQKLKELIRKCEELELTIVITLTLYTLKTKSILRGITSENTNNKRV